MVASFALVLDPEDGGSGRGLALVAPPPLAVGEPGEVVCCFDDGHCAGSVVGLKSESRRVEGGAAGEGDSGFGGFRRS